MTKEEWANLDLNTVEFKSPEDASKMAKGVSVCEHVIVIGD